MDLTVGEVLNDASCAKVPFTPGTFRVYRRPPGSEKRRSERPTTDAR